MGKLTAVKEDPCPQDNLEYQYGHGHLEVSAEVGGQDRT